MIELDAHEQAAADRCARLGLRPLRWPLGDCHHTEVAFTEEDQEMGDALAWFLGTLFSDVEGEGEYSRYWYHVRTSSDEWMRVARALRVHGLTICCRDPQDGGEAASPEGNG